MIYAYFAVIVVLLVGGFAYFALFDAFDTAFTTLETAYPAYYAGAGPDFIYAVVKYSPLLIILIPIVIYMIVQSQKPTEVYV